MPLWIEDYSYFLYPRLTQGYVQGHWAYSRSQVSVYGHDHWSLGFRSTCQMSYRTGKPTISIGENKGVDQLRSYCEADQRLCFRYMYSTFPRLSKMQNCQPPSIFCDCTARFVLDLVRTQIVSFLMHRLK